MFNYNRKNTAIIVFTFVFAFLFLFVAVFSSLIKIAFFAQKTDAAMDPSFIHFHVYYCDCNFRNATFKGEEVVIPHFEGFNTFCSCENNIKSYAFEESNLASVFSVRKGGVNSYNPDFHVSDISQNRYLQKVVGVPNTIAYAKSTGERYRNQQMMWIKYSQRQNSPERESALQNIFGYTRDARKVLKNEDDYNMFFKTANANLTELSSTWFEAYSQNNSYMDRAFEPPMHYYENSDISDFYRDELSDSQYKTVYSARYLNTKDRKFVLDGFARAKEELETRATSTEGWGMTILADESEYDTFVNNLILRSESSSNDDWRAEKALTTIEKYKGVLQAYNGMCGSIEKGVYSAIASKITELSGRETLLNIYSAHGAYRAKQNAYTDKNDFCFDLEKGNLKYEHLNPYIDVIIAEAITVIGNIEYSVRTVISAHLFSEEPLYDKNNLVDKTTGIIHYIDASYFPIIDYSFNTIEAEINHWLKNN